MTDIVERLRSSGTNGNMCDAAAYEIEQLRRDLDVQKMIVGLLRSQLRVLGHEPMVVENDAVGKQEMEMRRKAIGH